MIAAGLEVVRSLGANRIIRRILRCRLCSGGIELRKGNGFEIRRRELPPVVDMEHIGRIGLVGDPDPRADLSLMALVLHCISPHAEVERPVIVRAPLILNPEFLAPTDQSIVRIDTNQFPVGSDPGSVRIQPIERKQSRLVHRLCPVDLESDFDHMFLGWNIGVIQSKST